MSAPYVRAGVYIVAASWVMGPAALLGAAGPAIGAAEMAGLGVAVDAVMAKRRSQLRLLANPSSTLYVFNTPVFWRKSLFGNARFPKTPVV